MAEITFLIVRLTNKSLLFIFPLAGEQSKASYQTNELQSVLFKSKSELRTDLLQHCPEVTGALIQMYCTYKQTMGSNIGPEFQHRHVEQENLTAYYRLRIYKLNTNVLLTDSQDTNGA